MMIIGTLIWRLNNLKTSLIETRWIIKEHLKNTFMFTFIYFLANPSSYEALTVTIIFHEFLQCNKIRTLHKSLQISCWWEYLLNYLVSTLCVASESFVFKFMTWKSIIASYNLLGFNFRHFWNCSKLSKRRKKWSEVLLFAPMSASCRLFFFGEMNFLKEFFPCSWYEDCLSWAWIGCLLNWFFKQILGFTCECFEGKWEESGRV